MRTGAFGHLPRQLEPSGKETTMPRMKKAAKENRTSKAAAVTALGAAGLGLSLVGSASASTMPAAIPQSDNTSSNQRFVLGEEEMADISLATFHLFDKENFGSGVQVAWSWLPRLRWLPWLPSWWLPSWWLRWLRWWLRRLLRTLGTVPLVLGPRPNGCSIMARTIAR